MGISEITSRKPVLQAIKEFDELGREAFLEKYKFDVETDYSLVYKGSRYDSKAIIGVAYKYAVPGASALNAHDFSGGEHVKNLLESLRFTVRKMPVTWIFQGVPDKFYIREYLNTAVLKSPPHIVWTVTHHENELKTGDDVFIWQAKGKQPESSGILALCEIVSDVTVRSDDNKPISYWKPGANPSEDRKRVTLRVKSLAAPDQIIRRDFLKDDTVCQGMHILKNAMGTNFSTEDAEQVRLHDLWNNAINPLETNYFKTIEQQAQENENLSLQELEQRYEDYRGNNEGGYTTTTISVSKRNPYVGAIRKKKANYQCEVPGCTNKPFKKATDKWYCEVHHILPLSENGPDIPENTACLCPNHHREIHYGKDAAKLINILIKLRKDEAKNA